MSREKIKTAPRLAIKNDENYVPALPKVPIVGSSQKAFFQWLELFRLPGWWGFDHSLPLVMSVHFFNTLSRRLEAFHPLEPGKVRFYSCGPTVYNYAHVGNYRAYVFEDLVHRYLEFRGLGVTQVMNLTDVDDKTIRGALEQKLALKDYTRPYIEAFFADLKTLNITPADRYPAATDHIPEMITLIGQLLAKGHAYQSEDKSVYYRIESFPNYGCLACLDKSGHEGGRAGGAGRIREGQRGRLRLVEGVGREGRRRVVGFAVGSRAAGLAHRMFGHEHEISW